MGNKIADLPEIQEQIAIWETQAQNWMNVVHTAIEMFPEIFLLRPTRPEETPAILIGLLAEARTARDMQKAFRKN